MNICVYGAASNAIDKSYIDKTEKLGLLLAKRGHNLVYGAGGQGLMGAVARGVYSGGGKITGVVPSFFKVDGVLFENCTELIYTETMRERKRVMEENADAFIMVPGGVGTFDEFFEILTLKQLGRHQKAIAIFNYNGYYDALKAMLDKAVEGGFVTHDSHKLYCFFDNCEEMVSYLENYTPEEFNILKLRGIK